MAVNQQQTRFDDRVTSGEHVDVPECGPTLGNRSRPRRRRYARLPDHFLRANFDIEDINQKTLAVTSFVVPPSYAQVVRGGMAAVDVTGDGGGGAGRDVGGAGERGFFTGRGGGRSGGGHGARGGRHAAATGQSYGTGVGFYNDDGAGSMADARGDRQGPGASGFTVNYNDVGSRFNGSRFNPNLGSYPLNFGPGWAYERGRRGRHGGNGGRGRNTSYRPGRNFQRYLPHQEQQGQQPPQQHTSAPAQVPNQQAGHQQQVPQPPPVQAGTLAQSGTLVQSQQAGQGVEQTFVATNEQQPLAGHAFHQLFQRARLLISWSHRYYMAHLQLQEQVTHRWRI